MSNPLKRSFVSKKIRKQAEGECRICKNNEYSVLDVHRINEGKDGGKYTYWNTTVLCCVCHRKQQAGIIKVNGWVSSTAGRLLHWIDEHGNEHFD